MPPSLEALLSNQRFPRPIKHLRRVYAAPMKSRPSRLELMATATLHSMPLRFEGKNGINQFGAA